MLLTLRQLTEEVGAKSQAISILDQEKSALIRDLFQVSELESWPFSQPNMRVDPNIGTSHIFYTFSTKMKQFMTYGF